MKLCFVGDVHFSQYSSILRRRGTKYSQRLENLILSIDWAESFAKEKGCNAIFYLGDFFDKPDLNSEEISALAEITFIDIEHYFLCGNHEISTHNLTFNSVNMFKNKNNVFLNVIDFPHKLIKDDVEICFLPYVFEDDRLPIEEYFGKQEKYRIILSHNDIKDFQMGPFKSQVGFEISNIEENCNRYINGHLHNGGKVTDKIINIGNLTGQNFSEDAFKYDHCIFIFDTETKSIEVYENPFALNFYKLDFTDRYDIDYINSIRLKRNAVVTVTCNEDMAHYLKVRFDPECIDEKLPKNCNVLASRTIVKLNENINVDKLRDESFSVDYLKQFNDFILEKLGNTDVVASELLEVCR